MLKSPNANIYLTGFMATGKSSIGRILAQILNWKHYDLDKLIGEQTHTSIATIFETEGEQFFRNLELKTVQEFKLKKKCVISLGGGSLTQKNFQSFVKNNGLLVCLKASPETILERVNLKKNRPLINSVPSEEKLSFIKEKLQERLPQYQSAEIFIKTDENSNHLDIANLLLQKILLHQSTSIMVNVQNHSYPIYIDKTEEQTSILTTQILKIAQNNSCPNRYFIIVDSVFQNYHSQLVQKVSRQFLNAPVFSIEASESIKNLDTVQTIIRELLKHRLPRKSTLVSLGGGIIGDIVGFVASIYLRGIPFIQIPTTLLSMVDSSVGGKTGVNHPLGKNLIGSFYQPQAVISDLNLLKTLPKNEYLAGIGEAIKYGVIWDLSFFNFLKNNSQDILNQEPYTLKQMIQKCCAIKAEIVNQDEKEQNLRMILNYGHTFAHAIEVMSGYNQITHGLAVALGMRVAGRVATLVKSWTKEEEVTQTQLLDLYNMPKTFKVEPKKAWKSILLDKKANKNQQPVFILPTRIGKVKEYTNIEKSIIDQAWIVIKE